MKTIILITLCHIVTISSFAQKSKTSFKILAGVSLPKYSVSGGTGDNKKINRGYTTGILVSSYKDAIGLNFGLNYIQAGAVNPTPAIAGATKSKNRLNYLSGDILLSYKLESTINLEIFGGSYLAKLLKGNYDVSMTTGSNQKGDFKIGTKTTDDFIPLDLGVKFGMCFNIKRVSIGITLQQGFSDIAPQKDIKIHNQIYAFTLGCKLTK